MNLSHYDEPKFYYGNITTDSLSLLFILFNMKTGYWQLGFCLDFDVSLNVPSCHI